VGPSHTASAAEQTMHVYCFLSFLSFLFVLHKFWFCGNSDYRNQPIRGSNRDKYPAHYPVYPDVLPDNMSSERIGSQSF
jgi:hypothetical protein